MSAVEIEPETCRCKIFNPYDLRKTYSQRTICKMGKCYACCEKSEKFTVNEFLEFCQQEPDCIINLYKASTSSDKCLPDLVVESVVQEVQTERPKNVGKATSEAINLGDSKYHYLMVDGFTNVAVPFDAKTMSIDSNTWICERINSPHGEVAYLCKKLQTKESQEISLPEDGEKSLSTIISDTRKSIHTFFSSMRRLSRQNKENKKAKKLMFADQPSVLLLRRSQSLPARKGRWSTTTDYEMLKFVVKEQKDKANGEDTESTSSPARARGVCAPILRLFNSIKAKLNRKKQRYSRQSTHVIKVIYVEEDETSLNPSMQMKHDNDLHL